MANRWGARPVTEGALLAAVTVVLALIGQALPLVGLFVPVPIVYVALRHGARTSLLATVVAGLALALTLGPGTALMVTATFGSVGVIVGLGARRHWPVALTLALATVAGLVVTVAQLVVTAYILMGLNLTQFTAQMVQQTMAIMRDLLKQYPTLLSAQLGPNPEAMLQQLQAMLPFFFWVTVVAGSVPTAVFQYAVIRWTLKRMRVELEPLPPFANWRIPGDAVLPFAVALGIGLLGERLGLPAVTYTGFGGALVLFYAYGMDGLALVYAVLRHFGFAKASAVLFLLLVFFGFSPILPIIGLLDSLMDFRLMLLPRED